MCACFGMLRPYVVFWNASLWFLSGNAGDAAQPAPSLGKIGSESSHVELEYEGFLVESPSTSGVSGWVYYLVVVIQPNMSVILGLLRD